ncbi:MAG: pyridoxamine 5'-phosphate oxidase [Deltaproteobacteria bacterium]|nr:pyridoxamine 5'-phosphate oxidase [Deltaproteobacteria bacterium]
MNIAIPDTLPQSPFSLVSDILNEAKARIHPNPLAMILATADTSGKPSSRTVLLKKYDETGFVFFTNSQSRKGCQMRDNPFASLTFYLEPLGKQIQVEGSVQLIDPKASDLYWQTRSRESQIGAWASAQSREIPPGDDFKSRYANFKKKFDTVAAIPRPSHWNGYRVSPKRIEIWFEGDHRLHHRICYLKSGESWSVSRLYP